MAFDRIIEQWLGYNWIIYSTRDPLIISAGISSVQFPQATVQYVSQKGLSTITQHIPVGITYSDLVLRAPVERLNTILYGKLNKMDGYLKGRRSLTELGAQLTTAFGGASPIDFQYENFVIVGFNGGAAIGKTPIGVWYCGNCLLSSYTVDQVSSEEAKVVMETAAYRCNFFKRQL